MALTTAEQAAAAIQRSRRPLVTLPQHYTLDAIASATAVSLLLKGAGKVVDVVADGYPGDQRYPFLPATDIQPEISAVQQLLVNVRLGNTLLDQFSYDVQGDQLTIYLTPRGGMLAPDAVNAKLSDFRYDLIITVNAADLKSLGSAYANHREFFERTTIINIDHQPANEHYGHINAVDLTAAATAEVIYDLRTALGPATPGVTEPAVEKTVATALLAGMIGATRSFRSSRVTAKTLRVASDLVSAGANREGIIRALYQSHSVAALKLWGRTLSRLQSERNGELVWAAIPEADLLATSTTVNDLPGLTETLLSYLPTAEVVVLLAQVGHDVTVRLTSLRNLHALQLSQPFPAQGDRRVATWKLERQNLPEAEREVISAIRENLQALLR